MYKVEVWHCDYCRKVLAKRSGMAEHEAKCPRNPATHSCGTCVYFEHGTEPKCHAGGFESLVKMRSNCPAWEKGYEL